MTIQTKISMLALVLLSGMTQASYADNIPEEDISIGEATVRVGWARLSLDLHGYFFDLPEYGITDWEYEHVLEPISEFYHYKFSSGILKFAPGNDPRFRLRPGEPPRTAVTGKDLDSDILVNLERINDRNSFRYAHSLGLIIHEFGHKARVYEPTVTQEDVDRVSQKVVVGVTPRESTFELLTINKAPVELILFNTFNSVHERHIWRVDYERLLPLVWLTYKKQFFVIGHDLFSWFLNEDRNSDPANYLNRCILVDAFESSEIEPGLVRLMMRTHHHRRPRESADIEMFNIPSVVSSYVRFDTNNKKLAVNILHTQAIAGAAVGRSQPLTIQLSADGKEIVGASNAISVVDGSYDKPIEALIDLNRKLYLQKIETVEWTTGETCKPLCWKFKFPLPERVATGTLELLAVRFRYPDPVSKLEHPDEHDHRPKVQQIIAW